MYATEPAGASGVCSQSAPQSMYYRYLIRLYIYITLYYMTV